MTAISTNPTGLARLSKTRRAPGFLARILSLLVQYDAFHGELERLRRKSDRDLADIGISREDLVGVAWKAAEARRAAYLGRH
ncbi:hypothetical protein [Paracoccus sp. ME4]|uniref:hypothetical protein n=1 Tax=Paracoccus sp. ME4 TaxID=3138066 RepID=UPI00398B8D7F